MPYEFWPRAKTIPALTVADVMALLPHHGLEKLMRTRLRKVGNSRVIIIPAALLAACEMGDEMDIRLEGKNLVIAPIKVPRTVWFDGYKPEADTEPLAALPVDEGIEECWRDGQFNLVNNSGCGKTS